VYGSKKLEKVKLSIIYSELAVYKYEHIGKPNQYTGSIAWFHQIIKIKPINTYMCAMFGIESVNYIAIDGPY